MTHTKDEALKLAAEFDKRFTSMNGVDVPERVSVPRDEWRALHEAIKQAIAAPAVREPVAWAEYHFKKGRFTGLTTNDINAVDSVGDGCQWVPQLQATTPAQPAPCTWTQSPDPNMPDTYAATCGAIWTFTEGGPAENNMHFCPECGARVEEDQP
jgi:hypothetical protein